MRMRYLFLMLLISLFTDVSAQDWTIVKGRVMDQKTGEPMSGAMVHFIGTENRALSNFEGYFQIKTQMNADSLSVSYVGYATQYFKVQMGSTQTLKVQMVVKETTLAGVKTTNKINRAIMVIEKAQNNKQNYNFEKLDAFECESFTKVQIAVNNVSEELKNKKLLKQVEGIFDTISYLSEDRDKLVLPIFLSENLSQFYFKKNPKQNKEVILASRVKGVGVEDGTFLSQLLGSTFQQYNFNDNILPILEKSFISPISKSSFTYYNYKLVGSHYPEGSRKKIYQIEVTPKNPLDLVFTGYVWIEDSTFALRSLSLSITNKANLNFIEKLKITQELAPTAAGAYVPVKSRILIDIAEMSKKSAGMIAMFSNSYEKIAVNIDHPNTFYDYPIIMTDGATTHSNEYWDTARHEALSADEKRVLSKIDTLTNVKVIKNYVEFINIAFNGYKTIGKIDWGPYAMMYGYNVLEGHRLRLGMKTNFHFSKNYILSAYTAYGFSDSQFKFKLQTERVLNRKHWTMVGASYKKDVEQIGVTDDYYGSSNLFTAVSVFAASQLNRTKESKVWFNSEFKKGWNFKLVMMHKEYQFQPIKQFNFAYFDQLNGSNSISSDFTNTTMTMGLRWAPKEYYLQNDNERVKQSKPGGFALSLNYTHGFKGVFGSRFDYNRVTASIEKGLSFGYWGRTDFTLSATKIFETLPYPLLEVHRGNQSFVYSTSAYNLMNFFEFITDQSVFLKMEHHFNGAILNRVPIMKKLKWREFFEARAVLGTISDANKALIPKTDDYNRPISQLENKINKEPYIEMAYGLENVFKVMQIAFVHRLTQLEGSTVRKFGIKLGLSVSF